MHVCMFRVEQRKLSHTQMRNANKIFYGTFLGLILLIPSFLFCRWLALFCGGCGWGAGEFQSRFSLVSTPGSNGLVRGVSHIDGGAIGVHFGEYVPFVLSSFQCS